MTGLVLMKALVMTRALVPALVPGMNLELEPGFVQVSARWWKGGKETHHPSKRCIDHR